MTKANELHRESNWMRTSSGSTWFRTLRGIRSQKSSRARAIHANIIDLKISGVVFWTPGTHNVVIVLQKVWHKRVKRNWYHQMYVIPWLVHWEYAIERPALFYSHWIKWYIKAINEPCSAQGYIKDEALWVKVLGYIAACTWCITGRGCAPTREWSDRCSRGGSTRDGQWDIGTLAYCIGRENRS